MIGIQKTFEALGQFFFGGKMKEHKSNQELLEYIQSKGVKVKNRKKALENMLWK